MWIVEVIPISKGMRKDTLSYFSSTYIPQGSMVRVPLRNKTVPALVLTSDRIEDKKSHVRQASFELKKITVSPGDTKTIQPCFSPAFMKTINQMATYYATGAGEIISSFVPHRVIDILEDSGNRSSADAAGPLPNENSASNTDDVPDIPDIKSEVLIFQAEDDDRIGHYRSLAREAFARKQSIIFIAPGSRSVHRLAQELSKGIEEYTVTLHGDLKPKEETAALNKIKDDNHVLIIVATAGYIALNRKDVGTIVIESERSSGYRGQVRPFIDARRFIQAYARNAHIRLIRGDNFLSTETWHAFEIGQYACLEQPRTRAEGPADVAIIDMRTEHQPMRIEEDPDGRLHKNKDMRALISPALNILIGQAREKGERIFIFTARKGLAPVTVCGDCGSMVRCHHCNRAMVLHSAANHTFFLCHHCGERSTSETRCATCQSWKLVPLGAGTEKIKTLLEERWPGITVFILDKDHAKTALQAEKIVRAWHEAPGSILIGTELAFGALDTLSNHTRTVADHAVILSADALLALSDYAAYEKMMAVLLETRRRARATFLIQTRVPQDPIFEFGLRGMIKEFHHHELAARKAVGYPPFSTLIRIEVVGIREKISAMMGALKHDIIALGFECDIFPSFIKKAGGASGLALMIRHKGQWPHEGLVALLKSLPPQVSVMVDAEGSL